MTTATSTRQKTEFLVSQDTSSKEVFDHLTELNEGKGPNADLPIRAYNEGRKGTTLKIYSKKTSAVGLFKAAANPQKVSARILVIETIEKILKSESEKNHSPEEKKTIDQVLGNIKAKKSHCRNHDVKIPDLIYDLSKLIPIWDKSSAIDKSVSSTSTASTPQPKKNKPTKETKIKNRKPITGTEKPKTQAKAAISSAQGQNKYSVQNLEKPNLITKPIKTVGPITIQIKPVERSTNPFEYAPTKESQTPIPAPPTFFQRVSDFFKPVTNFFASVRQFFGFN